MKNNIAEPTEATAPNTHDAENKGKSLYAKPELIRFGKVAAVTKGGGSQFFDEGGIEPLF